MSSQTPSTSPASPPAPHGGAMDPNELRLRQARAQQTPASSAHSAISPGVVATGNPPHGGDMDPNEVRLRLARMQQTSGSSSPALNNPEPSNTVASHGGLPMRPAEPQSAQYGSSSHLIKTPSSTPSGYGIYQTAQTPQSAQSGQYFPTQYGNQPSNPNQAQQSPQSPHYGLPTQVSYQQPQDENRADFQRGTSTIPWRAPHLKALRELHTLLQPHTDHPKLGR